MSISREEAVRIALAELGPKPATELSAFIEQRFGLQIEPKFIPIIQATLLGKEELAKSRAAAKALLANIAAAKNDGKSPGAKRQ